MGYPLFDYYEQTAANILSKFLWERFYIFCLGVYLEGNCWVIWQLRLHFLRNSELFFKVLHHFTFPPGIYEDSNLSNILTNTYYCLPFWLLPVDMKWYLVVLFICISLMTNDVEQFFTILKEYTVQKAYLTGCWKMC